MWYAISRFCKYVLIGVPPEYGTRCVKCHLVLERFTKVPTTTTAISSGNTVQHRPVQTRISLKSHPIFAQRKNYFITELIQKPRNNPLSRLLFQKTFKKNHNMPIKNSVSYRCIVFYSAFLLFLLVMGKSLISRATLNMPHHQICNANPHRITPI